jgi:hypothetical protein
MEQQERKTVIAVIGMHRSGTSALTRGLQVLGIALGEDLFHAAEGISPKGFWLDFRPQRVQPGYVGREAYGLGSSDRSRFGTRGSAHGAGFHRQSRLPFGSENRHILDLWVTKPRVRKLRPLTCPVPKRFGKKGHFKLSTKLSTTYV